MKSFAKFALLALTFCLSLASPLLAADMKDYCSAPPYVTRTIPPNVMILMDNSEEMMTSAYGDTFDPAGDYMGYFKPDICYSYSGGKFIEGSDDGSGNCTDTAPYRGRLMNWATMSKYDILQKVLVGGNATSKQGNAHTLVTLGGSWTKTYNNCEFEMNSGNLVISDVTADSCSLLDSTAVPIAMEIPDVQVAEAHWATLASQWVGDKASGLGEIIDSWQLVPEAHAAAACNPIVTGALDATAGEPYSLQLFASGCNNCTFTWSDLSVPTWLGSPTQTETSTKRTNGHISWSGTPTEGTYSFSASVTGDKCDGTQSISETVTVGAGSPSIDTVSLSEGVVGTAYSARLVAQGGSGSLTWSASNLPAGLSVTTETTTDGNYLYGLISGTPTEDGTFWVAITVTDGAGESASRTLPLTISSSGLTITTDSFPPAIAGEYYSYQLAASGGFPGYTWTLVSGLSSGALSSDGVLAGTAGTAGVRSFTVRVTDSAGTSVDKDFTLTVLDASGSLSLETTSLDDAVRGEAYSYPLVATGGTEPYIWTLTDAPTGLTVSSDGILSWTPSSSQTGDHTFTVTLTDSAGDTVSQSYTVTVVSVQSSGIRSSSFIVNVKLVEESFTDQNGNDIWDLGEWYDADGDGHWDKTPDDPTDEVKFVDTNGNGEWDGKKGVFQKFWDSFNPRARWGLTKFKDQSSSTDISVDSCIPAAPASSFYTTVQNATQASASPLASELYGAIQYYGFNSPYGNGYTGCANSDPINDIPCRKNFALLLTGGNDVSGTAFGNTADCTDSRPLVQNACVGYNTDLRSDRDNTQNVYTYVVNTMGTANNSVLQAAADAGGGEYYEATSYSDLEDALIKAFEDILAQAASGTAVSVLTTSSRGIGSMIQAYFLPIRQDGDREVGWTGYTQNLWIDNKDNLREDREDALGNTDHMLKLSEDRVLRLFFDSETTETKAALFNTDSEGEIANCTSPEIIPFADVSYNWEGGTELHRQLPSSRTLFTADKYLRVTDASGTVATTTISDNDFTVTNVTGDTTLSGALNADATYSAADIVRYARGECLETGVNGDAACASTVSGTFRDRRVTDDKDGVKKVWKLGDIISSTPKVLSNSPQNTYHIDYGDTTYHDYISSNAYQNRLSLALVGANDGVLHAFRVGYLEDDEANLPAGVEGFFQNSSSDAANDKLGQEVWGYIPFNAFPYLKYLADPDYCHIYYNDLSVRLVDVSLGVDGVAANDDPTDPRVAGSWRTVLIGGMRFGGGCAGGSPAPPLSNAGYSVYYAIDVTDPTNPDPLWEFSDIDMGFATTFPSIVRTGDKATNGNWYVLVGSGSTVLPNDQEYKSDIGRTTTGYIYILDLETGALVEKVDLGHNAIVGDILAVDADKDYDSEKIYFGTSHYNSVTSTWEGKLGSMSIPDQDLSASWTPAVKYLLTGDYPITASPDAAKDPSGNTWIYGGSGKYFSEVDEADATQHVMFGVKEGAVGASPIEIDATSGEYLDDRTNTETTGEVTGTTTVCMHNPVSNVFEERTMVTSITPTSTAATAPTYGWKVQLGTGERVITRPLAVGGLVDFLTYMPSADECSYGGDSYLYALDYTKGVAPTNIAIRTPDTTTDTSTGAIKTDGTVKVAKGVKLGPGAPPTGEAIIVPPPREGQEQLKKKIQIATGVIVEAENTPVISVVSKIVHWLKK